MMGYFGTMGWIGIAVMFLFWIGVILLAIAVARGLFPGERRSSEQVALEVLQRRYAAGEISAEEYEQARRVLGGADQRAG